MPATTPPDLTSLTRRCAYADHVGERELPFTSENFYIRPSGQADVWCRACVRAYNAARRQGRATAVRRPRATSTRKFGIEIEFVGATNRAVEREMRALGLDVAVEGYNHQTRAHWKIVTDASVAGGYELVSPPLSGRDGFDQVKKACQALAAAGARVDRQCGLHVHHEIRDLTAAQIKALVRGWASSQVAIDGLVAASRRNGRWAAHFTGRDLDHMERLADDATTSAIGSHVGYVDRYRALNLNGFPRYGTVELRQHQGTTNAKKIVAWIHFGQAMIKRAKDANAATTFTTGMTAELLMQLSGYGLPAAQRTYLAQRAERLATPAAERLAATAARRRMALGGV